MGTSFTVEFEDGPDDDRNRNDDAKPGQESPSRASGSSGSMRSELSPDYELALDDFSNKRTRKELADEAKSLGIPKTSSMNKRQLAEAIVEAKRANILDANRKELNAIAKSKGIRGYSSMKKEELQKLLLEAETPKKKYPIPKHTPASEPKNVQQWEMAKDIDTSFDPEDYDTPVTAATTSWTKPSSIDDEPENVGQFELEDDVDASFDPNEFETESVTEASPEPDPENPLLDYASKNPAPPPPEFNPNDPSHVRLPTMEEFENRKAYEARIAKLEKEEAQQRIRESKRNIGTLGRRANRQIGIDYRREMLARRREKRAIEERSRQKRKEIRQLTERGDSDRLIRRIATFGIGRAVGIDGGLITALAEILIFQPEIQQAEQEAISLLRQAEQEQQEANQELERSKTATGERRTVQSVDVAEILDEARARLQDDPENFDIGEVEAALQEVLSRNIKDPAGDVPDLQPGQQPGPRTNVYPDTVQSIDPGSPAGSGQPTGSPSPSASPGATGGAPPVGTRTTGGGGSGGSVPPTGGGASGGSMPPGGGGNNPLNGLFGNVTALGSSMAVTTQSLLLANVGLYGLKTASEAVSNSFTSIANAVTNPTSATATVQSISGGAQNATTIGGGAIGYAMGGPAVGLFGAVVGKAIGSFIIDPMEKLVSSMETLFDSVIRESVGERTLEAVALGDVSRQLAKIQLSLESDDVVGEFVETRNVLSIELMNLKSEFLQLFGPFTSEVVKYATVVVKLLENMISLLNAFTESGLYKILQELAYVTGVGGILTAIDKLVEIAFESSRNSQNQQQQQMMNSIYRFFGAGP